MTTWTDDPAALEAIQDWWPSFAPPPKYSVSEWADSERVLSPEASSEPGKWFTERAEYQRGIMDAVSDPSVELIVIMSSSQIGKTEIVNNMVGYHIDADPAPMLVVQPTLEMADAWSGDRLAPMLRDTPALQNKVHAPEARRSGNTKRHKTFPGGHITMAGANSAASLASRPIRILLADEVDRYPFSAGTEGDPINLARKRTTTFWNRKIIQTSTPTIKGYSRIEKSFELSDQRHYYVPCPHCGTTQKLIWKQVRWESGDHTTAHYLCPHCEEKWTDGQRWDAVRNGEWIAEKPFNGTAGFFIWEGYSPWVKLSEMVKNFLDAQSDPELLKVFINTSLGELWIDQGEDVQGHVLAARAHREDWKNGVDGSRTVPKEALLITCGVDTQVDRLEIERVAWGLLEESWSVEHHVIYGDLSTKAPWDELDEYLLTPTYADDNRILPVRAVAADSGGHYTDAVCQFAASRLRRRVYAIKGMAGPRPVWPKLASKNRKSGAPVFIIGVDSAKDMIYARLRQTKVGPGYCHFPMDRDSEWFDQLTSEVVVTEKVKGFPVRVWKPKPNTRQEALDCRVYAHAALRSMNINWGKVQRMLTHKTKETNTDEEPIPQKKVKQQRRKVGHTIHSSFVRA